MHKEVWLHPGLNLNSLVQRQELNLLLFLESPNPQPTLPVRDVTHIPWFQFLSGIFILTSLNDTSSPRMWTPALMLYLINPCTKRKVLILTKPKGKIYKTKSHRHYITFVENHIVVKRFIYLFFFFVEEQFVERIRFCWSISCRGIVWRRNMILLKFLSDFSVYIFRF